MDIWTPRPVISENSTTGGLAPTPFGSGTQVRPSALASSSRGCPPSTGTIQESIV